MARASAVGALNSLKTYIITYCQALWQISSSENREHSILIRQTRRESCGIIFLDKTGRRVYNEKRGLGSNFHNYLERASRNSVPKIITQLSFFFLVTRYLLMNVFLYKLLLLGVTLSVSKLRKLSISCSWSSQECTLLEPRHNDQTFTLLARCCAH